jgi:hypothetical protein
MLEYIVKLGCDLCSWCSEPTKTSEKTTVDVCHPSGSIRSQTLRKETCAHVPSIYEGLRRVTSGGLFPAFGVQMMHKNSSAGAGPDVVVKPDKFHVVTESASPLTSGPRLSAAQRAAKAAGGANHAASASTALFSKKANHKISKSEQAITHLGGKHAYLARKGVISSSHGHEDEDKPRKAASRYVVDANVAVDEDDFEASGSESVPVVSVSADTVDTPLSSNQRRANRPDSSGKAPATLSNYLTYLDTGVPPDTGSGEANHSKSARRSRRNKVAAGVETTTSTSGVDTVRIN